jgi:hypothetical protein
MSTFANNLRPVTRIPGNIGRIPRPIKITCSSVIKEFMRWDQSNGTQGYDRVVSYGLTTNKIKSSGAYYNFGFASYMRGMFRTQAGKMTSRSTLTFSDRYVSGSSPRQGFNVKNGDTVSLELDEDGTAAMILESWGNTRLALKNMVCTKDRFGGYITAKTNERNGTSLVTITLHKGEAPIVY